MVEPLEADDVMGILMTKYPGKYILASIDKDLKQIPGQHYNWDKDEFKEVSLDEGNLFFYTQVLTGDPTDGYSGCPNIGPKRASKILEIVGDDDEEVMWEAIVRTYEDRGLTEKDALVQARVARILRASDYNFKGKYIKLWTPNGKAVHREKQEV